MTSTTKFNVSSPDFGNGGTLPKWARDKQPKIKWSGAPAGTKSFALIMDDPDAPSGTFTHWVLVNMPPDAKEVPADAPMGKNDDDRIGYYGPHPPSGIHHYHFHVYALDGMLDLNQPDRHTLVAAMKGHILGEGEVVGTFSPGG